MTLAAVVADLEEQEAVALPLRLQPEQLL